MAARKPRKAILALEDGTWFEGESFGAETKVFGEVVFNTSMTGYQELLTDPSYKGQIVVMTYPHIGNTGVNAEDEESRRPFVEGFVVRAYCPHPSNWRAQETLGDYLKRHGIPGIFGVDTRALTLHLRTKGVRKGVLSGQGGDPKRLVREAKDSPALVGRDLVREVTCRKPYRWTEGLWAWKDPGAAGRHTPNAPFQRMTGAAEGVQAALPLPPERPPIRIVAVDCGIKRNILRCLAAEGFEVDVVPADTSAERLLDPAYRGVFLSNGPGDPEGVPYVVESVRKVLGRKPVFGICLGHQILALALGGRTYKMKFGHRGVNQPVLDTGTGRVEITCQNHGFAVDAESLDPALAAATHVNLSDGTSEGMMLRKAPAFSVQYHPEASAGPHDSRYLFRRFRELVEKHS